MLSMYSYQDPCESAATHDPAGLRLILAYLAIGRERPCSYIAHGSDTPITCHPDLRDFPTTFTLISMIGAFCATCYRLKHLPILFHELQHAFCHAVGRMGRRKLCGNRPTAFLSVSFCLTRLLTCPLLVAPCGVAPTRLFSASAPEFQLHTGLTNRQYFGRAGPSTSPD